MIAFAMATGNDPIQEQVTTIIARARSLGPRERAEYVRRACGSNETLLSQVLLALQTQTEGSDAGSRGQEFWDDVAEGESDNIAAAAPLEGQRLGPYRIERKLGSG